MATFTTDSIVIASFGYHMHGITPGSEYSVFGVTGDMIMVVSDEGVSRWAPSRYFTLKPKAKTKNAPRKMSFEQTFVGEWIVGSLHPQNGFSATKQPKPHKTVEYARAECERLSAKDSTKKFVYMQIQGACQAQGVVWD